MFATKLNNLNSILGTHTVKEENQLPQVVPRPYNALMCVCAYTHTLFYTYTYTHACTYIDIYTEVICALMDIEKSHKLSSSPRIAGWNSCLRPKARKREEWMFEMKIAVL